MIGSYYDEFGCGFGWTLYPPLSTCLICSCSIYIDGIIYGLMFVGISSTLTSMNFCITIINMRSISITISCIYIYVCTILITAILLLISLPFMSSAIMMLLIDVNYNTVLFDAIFGGDPILYQHLF